MTDQAVQVIITVVIGQEKRELHKLTLRTTSRRRGLKEAFSSGGLKPQAALHIKKFPDWLLACRRQSWRAQRNYVKLPRGLLACQRQSWRVQRD